MKFTYALLPNKCSKCVFLFSNRTEVFLLLDRTIIHHEVYGGFQFRVQSFEDFKAPDKSYVRIIHDNPPWIDVLETSTVVVAVADAATR